MTASGLPRFTQNTYLIFNLTQLFKNVMFMHQTAKYVAYIYIENELECKNTFCVNRRSDVILGFSLVSLNLSYIKSDCAIVWIT